MFPYINYLPTLRSYPLTKEPEELFEGRFQKVRVVSVVSCGLKADSYYRICGLKKNSRVRLDEALTGNPIRHFFLFLLFACHREITYNFTRL